jgi:hypothetical protein
MLISYTRTSGFFSDLGRLSVRRAHLKNYSRVSQQPHMDAFLVERSALGYEATCDERELERRVVPGGQVLPHLQLWTDSAEIPAVLHDALVKRVGRLIEVDTTNDGFRFGIDGHPSNTGVVVKRARKALRPAGGTLGDHGGFNAYDWDRSLGPAIHPGAGRGIGVAIERMRSSDARLEVIGDSLFRLDPRSNAVLVDSSITGPLFISYYAYIGRLGLDPSEPRPTAPDSDVLMGAVVSGQHMGSTHGIHVGDVVGNLKGYVESLDNHRTLNATVIGELHGHVDGTFQGESTGTFTGSALIDGGEISHLESLAVGTTAHTVSPVVIRASEHHVRLESATGVRAATIGLQENGEVVIDAPLVSVRTANIGALQSINLECAQLRALLGIRNSYAGVREVGVLMGVSDAEIERGLYFGQNRLAPVDGAFRIVRDRDADGAVELVVQMATEGEWRTVRPVGALGATVVGTPKSVVRERPGFARSNGRRPVLAPGEPLGDVDLPVDGVFSHIEVSYGPQATLVATSLAHAALIVPFATNVVEFATVYAYVFVSPAPRLRVWRGELPIRCGRRIAYGVAPLGTLELSTTPQTAAVAFPEKPFTIVLGDARRHFRQVIRIEDQRYAPRDPVFTRQSDGATYIARTCRGQLPVEIAAQTTTAPAPAAAIVPSTYFLRPRAAMGVDIIDALPGAEMTVYFDGELYFSRVLTTSRSTHSLGAPFNQFRRNARRLRVHVLAPNTIPSVLEFDVRVGTEAVALTDGQPTWTASLAFNWSQVPNATDTLVTFTETTRARGQVVQIPLHAFDGNVELDQLFTDGTYGDETAAYAFERDTTHVRIIFRMRRGPATVRLRSVVAAAT